MVQKQLKIDPTIFFDLVNAHIIGHEEEEEEEDDNMFLVEV